MTESAPPSSDRRNGVRHLACFAACVERDDGATRTAMIYDLSVSGALLLVRTSKLGVGDTVRLKLYITEEPEAFREANGRVVRVEDMNEEAVGLWSRRVAVHFDDALTIYANEIAALKARLKKLGIGPTS